MQEKAPPLIFNNETGHDFNIDLYALIVAATAIFDKNTMPDEGAFRINIKKVRFILGLSLY